MKNRIKELREQKRISQVCLATHIGCSQNTISKMELEMSEPKASQLLEMAKYFNVSVDYILCNSDYKYRGIALLRKQDIVRPAVQGNVQGGPHVFAGNGYRAVCFQGPAGVLPYGQLSLLWYENV